MGDLVNSNSTATVAEQGEIPCSNDAQFWLDLGRAVGDDDTINPCVDVPSVVIIDSSSTTTTAPLTEESKTSTTTVEYKTFYSCSGDAGSSEANDASSIDADATQIKLMYDYELYTSSPLDNGLLSSLSNDMVYDLADRYGLVDCNFDSSAAKRRSLRSLKKGDVIALDSMPLDKSLADKYECEVQVTLSSHGATTCTPIRGSMIAWLPKSTSNTVQIKSELLTEIENGMISNSYTNEDVVKVVFVGKRTTAVVDNDGSKDLEVNKAKEDSVVGSRNSKSSNRSPLIAIGVSLFFVAIALAVMLVMYNRRKRQRKYFSDGPDDMGYSNNNSSLAAKAALADRQQHFASRDPDDIQLLPSMDKIDMRSVYSTSTDAETENYMAGSDLAVMGMWTSTTQTLNNEAPSVE